MSNKSLSSFIPNAVLDAYKPVLAVAWELSAAMYMVAIWLLVISSLISGFTFSFHGGLDSGPWAGGVGLPLLVPITIAALAFVVRTRSSQSSASGLWLLDASLTLFFLLGLLAIAVGAVGLFASFGDGTFGSVVADFIAHLGDVAFGVVGVLWSLTEVAGLRKYSPVATATVTPATWGATAPTSAPVAAEAPVAPAPPPPPAGPTA